MSLALFYGYVVLLVIAGGWGAFGLADLDQRWLFDLDVDDLSAGTAASLLSQYRFLRAIELGFGVLAIRHARDIYHDARFGRPFLAVMTLGVVARGWGILLDGWPSLLFLFFLVSEALGAVSVYAVARRNWEPRATGITASAAP